MTSFLQANVEAIEIERSWLKAQNYSLEFCNSWNAWNEIGDYCAEELGHNGIKNPLQLLAMFLSDYADDDLEKFVKFLRGIVHRPMFVLVHVLEIARAHRLIP